MNRTKPRVLIVDDDATTNLAICMFFRIWGFESIGAATVAEAIDALGIVFDLIVLDFMLPDGDGTGVMEAVASRGLGIPIAIATGIDEGSPKVEEIRRKKPAYLLFKPMAISILEAVAADVRERFVQSRIPRP